MNVGKTAVSMANAAANMASSAMNLVNTATGMACHEQRDSVTTPDPRHMQLILQGSAGR